MLLVSDLEKRGEKVGEKPINTFCSVDKSPDAAKQFRLYLRFRQSPKLIFDRFDLPIKVKRRV